jgi:hypothetical protein
MAEKLPKGEAEFAAQYLRAETRHPWDPSPEKQDIFDATDEKSFESHILLEVVTNYVVNHGNNLTHHDAVPHHARGHAMELSQPLEPSYERYRYLTVMAGPSFKNIQRVQQIHGSSNYMAAYKFNTTGVIDAALVPTLVPDVWKEGDRQKDSPDEFTQEDYLWVDMTYPLRGIYIPKSRYQCPHSNRLICVYTHVDFRVKHSLSTYTYMPEQGQIPDEGYTAEEPELPTHEKERQRREPDQWTGGFRISAEEMVQGEPSLGWGLKPGWTARFQIDALRELAIEADAREYIKLFDSDGLVIRPGGELRLRAEKWKTNPVHTMESSEVIRLPIPPLS